LFHYPFLLWDILPYYPNTFPIYTGIHCQEICGSNVLPYRQHLCATPMDSLL
jgi:hypothetical protein